eukprot:2237024-Alexandrium_andersonii.AAC.1
MFGWNKPRSPEGSEHRKSRGSRGEPIGQLLNIAPRGFYHCSKVLYYRSSGDEVPSCEANPLVRIHGHVHRFLFIEPEAIPLCLVFEQPQEQLGPRWGPAQEDCVICEFHVNSCDRWGPQKGATLAE